MKLTKEVEGTVSYNTTRRRFGSLPGVIVARRFHVNNAAEATGPLVQRYVHPQTARNRFKIVFARPCVPKGEVISAAWV
ncbi:MAG: hypothetical protein JJ908_09420 [Rhizobiales bacterium]|nr:hypothetical protein [Hyphomicrobiales bacterium]MBO6699039.1 hypothetical protein [Hyphomicrobiales bacterium]MBO6736577.1 hypothetical protein [Hyphomicrobiales bacterium]MBO6912349.1 hypothetical protein [Hyphomicrobiales bacterium]MBO6956289.1 hypothetical protein [Hyphomicrobiales bacterium]